MVLAWTCGTGLGADPTLDKYYNANALCRRGLFPLAIKDYKSFLAKNPTHPKAPKARWGLAICYYGTGRMDKAAELFAKLAGSGHVADQEQLHNLWGSALLELGKNAESAKAFAWTVKNGKKPARKADALTGLTQAQFLLEKWKECVQASDQLIRLAPASTHIDMVRHQGAVARLRLGQHAEAVQAFGGLIATGKDAELVHQSAFQAAECLVKLQKLAEAVKMYESAAMTKTGKYSETAHFDLGLLQFRTKRYAEAVATFKSFLKKYRETDLTDEASLLLGRAYLESGKHKEATGVFDGVLRGLKGDAGKRRRKRPPAKPLAVSNSSAGAQATLWLVRTYARQGRHATVCKLLAPVISNYRSDPARCELYYELATAQMHTGAYADAAKSFAEAEKGPDPLPVEALRLRAFCLYRAGKCSDSLPLCEAFLKKHADSPYRAEVLFLQGEALIAMKRLADAIGAFEAATKAGLDAAKAKQSRFRIAQAYYHQKKWPECLTALQPLLADDKAAASGAGGTSPGPPGKKKPKRPPRKKPAPAGEMLYDQVWFMAGDCHFRLAQWPRAIQALEAFLQKSPKGGDPSNAARARYNLALAYQKVGKPAEAIASLQPFLRLQQSKEPAPEALRVQALLDLGRLQYETGDFSKARETLRRLRDNPDAIYYLGWVAVKLGKDADAVRYFGELSKHRSHRFSSDAALQRSVLLYRAGKYAEAEATLSALAKSFGRNTKAPDYVDTLLYLGLCRARLKKYDPAVECFRTVVRQAGSGPRAAEALYWQAWCERQRSKARQAESLYVSFLSKHPAHKLLPAATLELAELRFHRHQQKERLAKGKDRHRKPKEGEKEYAAIAALLRSVSPGDRPTRPA